MLTQERPDVPPSNRISVILEGEAKAFSSAPGAGAWWPLPGAPREDTGLRGTRTVLGQEKTKKGTVPI